MGRAARKYTGLVGMNGLEIRGHITNPNRELTLASGRYYRLKEIRVWSLETGLSRRRGAWDSQHRRGAKWQEES